MKESKQTSVGAPVFFERLADDGWPEDAGWWPERIGGGTLRPVHRSDERGQGVRRFSPSQFMKSFLQRCKSKE